MKIAIISEWWFPIYGWGQIHINYLSQILVKKYGYAVDIITRKIKGDDGAIFDQDEVNEHGVRIIRVWPVGIFFHGFLRMIYVLTMTFYLLYKAKKENYDIIHAHSMLPGLPAKLVSFLTGIPVVFTVHGTMFLDAQGRWPTYMIEKLLVCGLRYNLEISVSKNILRYPNRNKNIKIIHNGVDLEKLNSITIDKKYSKLTFLSVGRMDRQKNYQIILDAIVEIWPDFFRTNAIQFVRVGDGLHWEQLYNYVDKNNLNDIVLLRWKLAYEATIKEFKKSHLFLLPSLAEGQPLTILEALGCSLPVLASDVWDNSDIITNDYNGEVFMPGDLASLIQIIKKYASNNKDTIERMWVNGYDFVQNYSWEVCADKVVTCYKQVKD